MVRQVLLPVLRFLDRLVQLVVPADPRRVAWISDPDYIGNAYHLYRHMVTTRRDLHHVWLVVDEAAGRRIEADFARLGGAERGHRLEVVPRHGPRGYLAYLRCRRVFHTHGVYRWVSSAVRRDCVSLWHGMPIKAIGALNTITPNPHPTFGTHHLATSEFFRYVIAAAFRAAPDEVILSGLPRCDVLRAPSPHGPSRAEVCAALGLPADQRLVLWLPTYRSPRRDAATPGATVRTFLDDLPRGQWDRVARDAARTGCTVVVKPHPYDPLNEAELDLDRPHVRFVTAQQWLDTGIELYDALAVMDGLISDVSSVLLDWWPTGRPLGMVGFDPATYTRDVLFDPEVLHASSRTTDLADDAGCADFFDAVAEGRATSSGEDGLSRWLAHPDVVDGCERVLAAVRM